MWLPHALDSSADRYGSIGVAFTYLAASVLGQVIATDTGWFGQWIRGERGKA